MAPAVHSVMPGTGDNDFQDVVIGVRANHDGIFVV